MTATGCDRVFRAEPSTIGRLGATGRRLLDLVFPWACSGCGSEGGAILCPSCLAAVRWLDATVCVRCGLPFASGPTRPCGRCLLRPPGYDAARALAVYEPDRDRSDALGNAIRAFKYAGRRALAGPLSDLLAGRFPFDPAGIDRVVAVPLHRDRLRERGYNQALLLGRGLCRRLGLRLDAGALRRVRPTAAQTSLTAAERRRNVRGAFDVSPGRSLPGLRVLLVDDVATSMATAEACAAALRRAGASRVDVLTLARARPAR